MVMVPSPVVIPTPGSLNSAPLLIAQPSWHRYSSEIGYGSLGAGFLAVILCPIPPISFLLGVVAIALGFASIISRSAANSGGLTAPALGICGGVMGVFVGMLISWAMLSSPRSPRSSSLPSAEDPLASPSTQAAPTPSPPPLPAAFPTAQKKMIRMDGWGSPSIPQKLGDVQVRISRAFVDYLDLRDDLGTPQGKSPHKYLTVRLVVENHSKSNRLAYVGWMGLSADEWAKKTLLEDDTQTTYQPATFSGLRYPAESQEEMVLQPENYTNDVAVFPMPRQDALVFLLQLPADGCGHPGKFFKFRLARDEIEWR